MPVDPARGQPRWRRGLATALLVVSGILLPVGLLAGWANTTFYESETFSQRVVGLLDSQAVRRELADRLTQQLALSGNQQAVNFRPAFQLAIESVVDTDTFRSIFRDAVRRAHETVVAGRGSGTALDLSDSLAIISGTLQLPATAEPGQGDERALGTSLTDVTDRMAGLGVWRFEDLTAKLFVGGVGGAIVAAAAAIALAADRRSMVARVGFVTVAGGLLISGLVVATEWYVTRVIADDDLAAAVRGAVSHGMADLMSLGLWTAAYGIVVAAAARSEGTRRLTPGRVASAASAWAERRRGSTGGTVVLGAAAILAGLVLIASPSFWLRVALIAIGLWLAYFGVAELVGLVRARVPVASAAAGTRTRRRRETVVAGVTAALLVGVFAGGFLVAGGAAERANAAGEQKCNGDASLCDLPLNLAVFPASHNSMSAALYPGWLFAEQARTIGGQLNAGVRGLLLDTHYGVPSSARLPGSETPVVLTDRAAELQNPVGSEANIDPAIAQRAAEVASRASPRANANREIYLCHNYCELGAVRFSDALDEIKTFLDHHPDDVVITIIQDATTPAETAAAIEQAGLGERVYTLDPNQPLPTLGDMIRAGRTLLVFAENSGPGAPPWYHSAYDPWFQETPYTFYDVKEMSCAPNRGRPDAPLFLVNHWINESPPNPKRAEATNARKVLEERARRCVAERGMVPNVVAVDFAVRGDLMSTIADMNETLVGQVRRARGDGKAPPPAPSTTTTGVDPAGAPAPVSSAPPIPTPTPIATLTGGDPRAFCERAPAVLDVVGAWALANVVALPGQEGRSDLAFAPAATRSIGALDDVAPVELTKQLTAARDRAQAALQAVRALGVDQGSIDSLADQAQEQLSGADHPDPVATEQAVLERLRSLVGGDRLNAAAREFNASNPEVPGLFDLGEVPDEVASNAGYDCLLGPG